MWSVLKAFGLVITESYFLPSFHMSGGEQVYGKAVKTLQLLTYLNLGVTKLPFISLQKMLLKICIYY